MSSMVYVFSLPRSGSTYLQRLIAANDKVCTLDEPWIFLPLLYPLRNKVYARYGHSDYLKASDDLNSQISLDLFEKRIVGSVEDCFKQYASDRGYDFFLEKTPRNLLVVNSLINASGADSKFIFLTRHPGSLIKSICHTWGNGRWVVYKYKIDLIACLNNLAESIKENPRSLHIRYEDLVLDKQKTLSLLSDYLCVDLEGVDYRKTKLEGRMGDPNRQKNIIKTSQEIDMEWLDFICNPLRKLLVKKYFRKIGRSNFELMGYNYDETMSRLDLKKISGFRYLFSDLVSLFAGCIYTNLQPRSISDMLKNLLNGKDKYINR